METEILPPAPTEPPPKQAVNVRRKKWAFFIYVASILSVFLVFIWPPFGVGFFSMLLLFSSVELSIRLVEDVISRIFAPIVLLLGSVFYSFFYANLCLSLAW